MTEVIRSVADESCFIVNIKPLTRHYSNELITKPLFEVDYSNSNYKLFIKYEIIIQRWQKSRLLPELLSHFPDRFQTDIMSVTIPSIYMSGTFIKYIYLRNFLHLI